MEGSNFTMADDMLRHLQDKYYEKEEEPLDYTVVSVGIMTLGLIIVVELGRHHLDHYVASSHFYTHVVQGVYSELATLGLVELFVFLLIKYYDGIDKERKAVFADVHFALFYTAIFNALQSVNLAVMSMKRSTRMWVDNENVDLDKYIKIREEFDQLTVKLFGEADKSPTALAAADNQGFLSRMYFNTIDYLRHPHLHIRYNQLLVKVRFHQLRVQFLDDHHLPHEVKVSDYLKRAEQTVFNKLVHVSTFAWLMLTGGLNLVYYLMGMVQFVSEDKHVVGMWLEVIFFGCMIVSISWNMVLYQKTSSIFRAILKKPHMFDPDHKEETKAGIKQQLDLFWGGDPNLVISMIQFMQFGYALTISIIIMYWNELTGAIPGWAHLIAVSLGYSLDVYIMAKIIPQYTLCTSLGYLVHKKHLNETMATYRLNQAKEALKAKEVMERESAHGSRANLGGSSGMLLVDSTPRMVASTSMNSLRTAGSSVTDDNAFQKNKILADLVKQDTRTLRNIAPHETQMALLAREERARSKASSRNVYKSMSDGVSAMRSMRGLPARDIRSGAAAVDSSNSTTTSSNSGSRPMASLLETTTDDIYVPRETSAEDTAAAMTRKERRKRLTISAPNMIKSWRDYSIDEEEEDEEESKVMRPMAKIDSERSAAVDDSDEDDYGLYETLDADEEPGEAIPMQKMQQVSRVPTTAATATATSGKKPASYKDEKTIAATETPSSDGSMEMVARHGSMADHGLIVAGVDHQDIDEEPKSCMDHVRAFFLQESYRLTSHIFGTMMCFFMIATRVEAMLASTGVMDQSDNTWELRLGASYFWELGLLCIFLCVSFFVIMIFSGREHTNSEQTLIFGAALDLYIIVACIACLIVAESQRCCTDGEDDYDGYASSEYLYEDGLGRHLDEYYTGGKEETLYIPCCAAWGSRTYGGLGTIEPFTALIALRVLRFYIAGKLVDFYSKSHNMKPEEDPHAMDPHHDDHDDHGHGHGNESALLLWEAALAAHPDIVKEHGEFSSEILQAMLGLIGDSHGGHHDEHHH